AGGGASNSARRRYVRRSTFEVLSIGHQTFPSIPDISFNADDGRDLMPHDDDPLTSCIGKHSKPCNYPMNN
ncbi:hypothetical protein A2U01_0069641, partial [Trifolium medium]|nr:hypothetical protein [Trifolium medium]